MEVFMSEQSLSKQELWVHRINNYRASGLTAQVWCQQNSYSVSTLRYWISTLKKKYLREKDSEPMFAEVPIYTSGPLIGAAPVTIHMGTIRIEILDSCHPDLLSSLIEILANHA